MFPANRTTFGLREFDNSVFNIQHQKSSGIINIEIISFANHRDQILPQTFHTLI